MSDRAYPDLEALAGGLGSVLHRAGIARGSLTVVSRERNRMPHTLPSEIVTCCLPDGRELRLFCKYEAGGRHRAHGHRRGLAYEATVYRRVLAPSGASAARCYGVHRERDGRSTWLVMDYVDGGTRLMSTAAPAVRGGPPVAGGMPLAARWLGRFHGAQDALPPRDRPRFLIAYSAAYYDGWARRTARFSRQWRARYPWVAAICERAAEATDALLDGSQVIVHGEFYPGNVLVRDGVVYPVDWESAAFAAGEVDLAALVGRWPAEIALLCEREYTLARWPAGPPPEFERRLLAARLYLQLRWLGDRPDRLDRPRVAWRFAALHEAARRLSLV